MDDVDEEEAMLRRAVELSLLEAIAAPPYRVAGGQDLRSDEFLAQELAFFTDYDVTSSSGVLSGDHKTGAADEASCVISTIYHY
jgi:hypothetical protein